MKMFKIKINLNYFLSPILLMLLQVFCYSCGHEKAGNENINVNDSSSSKSENSNIEKSDPVINKYNDESSKKAAEKCISKINDNIENYCNEQNAEWQVIIANGTPIGYSTYLRTVENDNVITCNNSVMTINRGIIKLKIESAVIVRESVGGKPLSYDFKMSGSGLNQYSRGKVLDTSIDIDTVISGRLSTKSLKYEDEFWFDEGIRLKMVELVKTKHKFSIPGFDPLLGEFSNRDYLVLTEAKDSNKLLPIEVTEKSGGISLVSTLWFNKKMIPKRSSGRIAGITFETYETDRDTALNNKPGELPFDIFESSFLQSPAILSKSIRKGTLSYRIRPLQKDKELSFVNSKEQSCTLNNGVYVVDINNVKPDNDFYVVTGYDTETAKYLQPNNWIQSDNPLIEELSKKAFLRKPSVSSIERFVSEYIRYPGLSTAYATALDVAQNRKGDCSEFALLTAGIFKAAKIPSRVVFGLVYTESKKNGELSGEFLGHAWTQIFVKDGWYSVDSALQGFDSGHIALGVSDGDPKGLYEVMGTFGEFRIESISK
ncbi:MAG: transglutaminase domain-containing protein [Deltaproteobacteria bacterium]|nr:transglutaminase domain-containing protein [Deltaproteobacteria bacterium]